jgi:putative solute:sodium symporter small subunit
MPEPDQRRPLYWLLVVPTVAPLAVPLYNRMDPSLLGVPFFYWYQLACAVLATVVISIVYLGVRR